MYKVFFVIDAKQLLVEFWFYFVFFGLKMSPFIIFIFQDHHAPYHNNVFSLGLSNNICGKHPILLLLSYELCLVSWRYYLVNNLFLLFLGSLWSSNEFNWGGFWSFDFVETTLLISYGYYVLLYHQNSNLFFPISRYFVFELSFFFFFLKFNSTDSIHSFISSETNSYFNNGLWFAVPCSHFQCIYMVYVYIFVYVYYSYVCLVSTLFILICIPIYYKYSQYHLTHLTLFIAPSYYLYKVLNQVLSYHTTMPQILLSGYKGFLVLSLNNRVYFNLLFFSKTFFYTPYFLVVQHTTTFIYKLFTL